MRLREWLFLLSVCGVGTLLANWIGSGVSIAKSLPGVIILIAVTMAAVVLAKIVPFKLPIIAYCSILGLLVASPFRRLLRLSLVLPKSLRLPRHLPLLARLPALQFRISWAHLSIKVGSTSLSGLPS